MIYKFNSASLPPQSVIDVLQIRQVTIAPSTLGWLATDKTGDVHLANDDYLFINNGDYKVIKRANYLANAQLNRFILEDVSRELISAIVQAVEDIVALTDADKIALLDYIRIPLILMAACKLVIARRITNGLSTTALFTTGRKTALLNLMDAAIARL